MKLPAWPRGRAGRIGLIYLLAGLAGGVLGWHSAQPQGLIGWLVRPVAGRLSVEQVQRLDRISQFSALGVPAGSVVLLGDSLTHEGEWPQWLGVRVINRGIRGDTVASLHERLAESLPACPARLHLLIGINDVLRHEPQPGMDGMARIRQAHQRLTAALAQRCPQSPLTVQALLPVNCALLPRIGRRCPDGFGVAWQALNTHLAEDVAASGGRFVDLNRYLHAPGQPDVLDPSLTHDGLHLNGEGYRRWATALAPELGLPMTR